MVSSNLPPLSRFSFHETPMFGSCVNGWLICWLGCMTPLISSGSPTAPGRCAWTMLLLTLNGQALMICTEPSDDEVTPAGCPNVLEVKNAITAMIVKRRLRHETRMLALYSDLKTILLASRCRFIDDGQPHLYYGG